MVWYEHIIPVKPQCVSILTLAQSTALTADMNYWLFFFFYFFRTKNYLENKDNKSLLLLTGHTC